MRSRIVSALAAGAALLALATPASAAVADAPAPAPEPAPAAATAPDGGGIGAPEAIPDELEQLSSGGWFDWLFPQTDTFTGNQGDKVVMKLAGCSIGYITDDYALTADHCGLGTLNVGDTVANDSGFTWGTVVATGDSTATSNSIPADSLGEDWAIIEVHDDATVGANNHSGDELVPADEVSVGDQACVIGFKTGYERCSTIDEVKGDHFITVDDITLHGDSGGAWYTPGEGLIGSNLGWTNDGRNIITALNDETIGYLSQ